jgi:hypothetical protein
MDGSDLSFPLNCDSQIASGWSPLIYICEGKAFPLQAYGTQPNSLHINHPTTRHYYELLTVYVIKQEIKGNVVLVQAIKVHIGE